MIVATRIRTLLILSGSCLALTGSAAAQRTSPSSARYWKVVEDALGRTGTPNPGDVVRFGFPRSDLLGPSVAVPQAALDLDTAAIATIIGVRGKVNGGVYQLTIPRREKIKHDKMEIPAAMGIATAINFQSTGAGKAAITGDFVLLGREVNSVIWALSEAGIQVTALHSHMIGEEPRLFFMHFWAIDDVPKLARGLKAALDRTRRR